MKFNAPCIWLLAASVSFASHAQAKDAAVPVTLHPGLWEITVNEQTAYTPNKRTTVSRVCFSPEDVSITNRVVPTQHSFSMQCDNLDIKVEGTALTWKVVCKGKTESSSGVATMTPASDSYVAQVKLDSRVNGKPVKVDETITGKRLGDCK